MLHHLFLFIQQALVRERLGKVRLRFGDVLLLQGPKESFLGLQTSRDLLFIGDRDLETLRRDKVDTAVAIGLGVVLAAAFGILPILVSALFGVLLMVLTGCLKPGEVYQAVRWDIIFLRLLLLEYYREDILQLQGLINRDLSAWLV